jgi:hypothetical protein
MTNDFDVISTLKRVYRETGTLTAVPYEEAFSSFIASDLLAEKVARFDNSVFNPSETSGLYSDNVIVYVLEEDEWNINLIRHAEFAKAVYSLPFPSLIGPIGNGSWCEIDVFDYPAEVDLDPGLGENIYARKIRTVKLKSAEFWSSSSDEPAYRLTGQAPDTIYLRITGPMTGPYSHAFRAEDLKYSYSGFSSPEVTGMDLFSNLVLASAKADYFSGLSHSEKQAVARLLIKNESLDISAPRSRWNLVQALYAIDPETALGIVREYTRKPGPLKKVALQTINMSSLENE